MSFIVSYDMINHCRRTRTFKVYKGFFLILAESRRSVYRVIYRIVYHVTRQAFCFDEILIRKFRLNEIADDYISFCVSPAKERHHKKNGAARAPR